MKRIFKKMFRKLIEEIVKDAVVKTPMGNGFIIFPKKK